MINLMISFLFIFSSNSVPLPTDYQFDTVTNKYEYFSDKYVLPKEKDNQNIDSKSYILLNITDKKIVSSKNITKTIYPASMTKLATVYMGLNFLPEENIIVKKGAKDINVNGSIYIPVNTGDKISKQDLLKALLLPSANDAGLAISCEFENYNKLQNLEMKKIGMLQTNFTNPHGLHDDNHYTTLYDLYILLNNLKENEEFLNIESKTNDTIKVNNKNINITTTNLFKQGVYKLPKNVKILAGKTGTTNEAGKCLIIYFSKSNKEYIAGIAGSANSNTLYNDMLKLINGAK